MTIDAVSSAVVSRLAEAGLTIAVAESLTGGRLTAALVDVPGASKVLRGGVIAYDTRIKHSVLGVDRRLLDECGAVDARVAEQMADRVRSVLAVDGEPADVGVSTTGVAGPDPQDGHEPGRVFVGIAIGSTVRSVALALSGSRDDIRSATVSEALREVERSLDGPRE